jgi:hypothetical protein
MPPIPKVTEEHKHPSKNFITENKNKIINSLPVRPHRYIVSDRKGNKFLIDGSGLQKDFIYKKVFSSIYSPKSFQFHLDRIMGKFHCISKYVKHLMNRWIVMLKIIR